MRIPRLQSQALLIATVAAMVGFYFLTSGNPHQEEMLAALSITLILIFLLMEKFAPFQKNWEPDKSDFGNDIAIFAIVFGLLDGALKWITPFAIVAVSSIYQPASTLPFWFEVPIAFLVIELMAWLSHWMHHRYRPLWALHAMHHAPEKLYTLNNFRFHPLNHIANHIFMLAPVLALGISAEAVLFYTIVSLPILALQHSNIDFDFGKLNVIFNTNVVHRYHHSINPDEGMSNLGRATVIWDHVFGTYHKPDAQRTPTKLGIFKGSLKNYPAKYGVFSQIAWPFSKACCA